MFLTCCQTVATSLTRPELNWLLRPRFADTLDLLSERDIKRYRLQRRLIGPLYHASSVSKYEQAIQQVLGRFKERLKTLNGAEVELKEWMHILTLECLGAVVLSWSPGMLKQGTDWGTSTHSYKSWRRKSVFGLFPTMTKLSFCSKGLGRLFADIWGITYQPPPNFRALFPVSHSASTAAMPVLRDA